jgi:DNA-binding PadR family transcriptional regulator
VAPDPVTPASVYQPSPGALYPALRRLEERGLLHAEKQVSSGRRALRLYQVTEAGLAAYLEWLRKPVVPETVGADLGDALDGFVRGMEQFTAARQGTLRGHARLALEHGIAIHRASLEWVGSALAALGETASMPGD